MLQCEKLKKKNQLENIPKELFLILIYSQK